jgi:L-asparaginase II
MTTPSPFLPLVELTRGNTVESVHFGALAVADSQGNLIASYGDPNTVTFLRSTAKPFQLLPFIEAGGAEHFQFTQQEIALMCASHSGTDQHVEVVSHIQQRVGITESSLMCGVHQPMHKQTAEEMLLRGETPTPNRHNCSGKHTGMLAFAKMRGEPLESYLEPNHPVQIRILNTFAEMCGLPAEEVQMGTDGCSAPNFAVPLYNAAWAWARLADPSSLSPGRAKAIRKIVQAMMAHPDMVGGPGRFDTLLMQTLNGRVVSKGGAEGYEGMGILPGVLGPGSGALGIALKISDGDGYGRAVSAVSMEVLRQLGIFSPNELETLNPFRPKRAVQNWRGLVVGEMRPVFDLHLN